MRFLRLLTFFPFLLPGSSPAVLHARAQGSLGKVLTDEVDAFINKLLADCTSPGGAAVAVVKLNEQGHGMLKSKDTELLLPTVPRLPRTPDSE
jgi:hypothetical protein